MQSVERWVTRSDAWTPEDDERLATLVLHHIRTGSTQLRAFEEAANTLGRTAAACGYRWNGVVRKDYREQIELAKKDRKSAGRVDHVTSTPSAVESTATSVTSSDSMREVVHFLQEYDTQYQRLRHQVDSLENERRVLIERIHALECEQSQPAAPAAPSITPEQLEEDSKALFAIMERARKLLESDSLKARGE